MRCTFKCFHQRNLLSYGKIFKSQNCYCYLPSSLLPHRLPLHKCQFEAFSFYLFYAERTLDYLMNLTYYFRMMKMKANCSLHCYLHRPTELMKVGMTAFSKTSSWPLTWFISFYCLWSLSSDSQASSFHLESFRVLIGHLNSMNLNC